MVIVGVTSCCYVVYGLTASLHVLFKTVLIYYYLILTTSGYTDM
jgi:hypothetical protein